jgi:hypothetical protein
MSSALVSLTRAAGVGFVVLRERHSAIGQTLAEMTTVSSILETPEIEDRATSVRSARLSVYSRLLSEKMDP